MKNKRLRHKLQALHFQHDFQEDLDFPTFQRIVLWLEEEKIRLYTPEERSGLRQFSNPKWGDALRQYHEGLGLKFDSLNIDMLEQRDRVLDKLLSAAVYDAYQDKIEGDDLECLESSDVPTRQKLTTGFLFQFISQANEILELLNLPFLSREATEDEILSALRGIQARINEKKEQHLTHVKVDLPIGFETPFPEIRKPITALRLLHGNELRRAQFNINKAINELQNITSNPKTDPKLGRIGM
ncbi:hypothetical protein IE077_001169 [Cardiosporidium cionae]|uniref:Uncharacterized protein n=1 Tax=Cardiosporidium cionae TaxID=476202 RepID=A0ABQ7J5S6_9APIC|nr:hypothetical protein IE077_001169 [Cardiosporidium cionae]|eukprot:KAF8819332.1 hypothetical protein IE077_001169 [Cardiosporidium cionae]